MIWSLSCLRVCTSYYDFNEMYDNMLHSKHMWTYLLFFSHFQTQWLFASSTKLLFSIWIEWYTTKCVYFAHPIYIQWKLILYYTSIQWKKSSLWRIKTIKCSLLLDEHYSLRLFLFNLNSKKVGNQPFLHLLKKETNIKLWCFLFCLNHCRALYIRQKPIILESTTQETIIHGIKISNFMLNLKKKNSRK